MKKKHVIGFSLEVMSICITIIYIQCSDPYLQSSEHKQSSYIFSIYMTDSFLDWLVVIKMIIYISLHTIKIILRKTC